MKQAGAFVRACCCELVGIPIPPLRLIQTLGGRSKDNPDLWEVSLKRRPSDRWRWPTCQSQRQDFIKRYSWWNTFRRTDCYWRESAVSDLFWTWGSAAPCCSTLTQFDWVFTLRCSWIDGQFLFFCVSDVFLVVDIFLYFKSCIFFFYRGHMPNPFILFIYF